MDRREITVEQFREEMKSQGKERIEDVKFICPNCGTHQSVQDFIDSGVGSTLDDIQKYIAFSCIGRFDNSKGCDWTLGGLFKIHTLEVVTPDGVRHPRFEVAK